MPKDRVSDHRQESPNGRGDRPGDEYNRHADWRQLLEPHGWRYLWEKQAVQYYRRPGKEWGASATVNYGGSGLLYVFSTSTAFESERGYSPFSAYTLLEHGGDFSAAAKMLAEQGYGGIQTTPEPEPHWPIRTSLPPATTSVPNLPRELIPSPIRGWLCDVADLRCVPLESVTVPAIVSLGAVVGRTVGIRAARYDDYLTVANFMGAVVGRSGVMKSSTIGEGLIHVKRLAATARERYQEQIAHAEARSEVITAQIAALRDEMKKAARSGEPLAEFEARMASLKEEQVSAGAPERRYITQDPTVEKLGELLRDNPRGLLLSRDELSGWLRSLDKPGREGDREFYLEAWNGTDSYTIDRIGRGTLYVPALVMSVVGGIQPGKLKRYIDDALADGAGADGLLQRLQLTVWPDDLGEWTAPDRSRDAGAKERAYKIFMWLDDLQPEDINASQVEAGDIPFVRFSPEAQSLYDEWRDELEHRLRGIELESTPAFESHIAKYRSLMPSLALLFHLIDLAEKAIAFTDKTATNGSVSSVGESSGHSQDVSLDAARLASAWCEFLEHHARKVYSREIEPGAEAAHTLAERVEAGAIPDSISVREIYRNEWSGLGTRSIVEDALAVLEAAGWVRIQMTKAGGAGRPSPTVRIHPDFRDHSSNG